MTAPHDLIPSFRRAHESILSAIDQVSVVARSYSQARAHLHELEERLLAHLGRQDKEFYKRLLDYYSEQREQKKMIEFLIHDLKETKVNYLIFFEKHMDTSVPAVAARNFPKDFAEFKESIINRVKVEEEYLFPLLQRMPLPEEPLPETTT